MKTLMGLDIPSEDPYPDLGSCRLSIGFMQNVMEYLSRPGDIVVDWSVGNGSSFFVADLCGRHLLGMENRKRLVNFARNACETTIAADRFAKPTPELALVVTPKLPA